MRQFTQEESAAFDKAEKRCRIAGRIRFRLAANRGAIQFINDLLVGLPEASPRTRGKLEAKLVTRKGHLLTTVMGLRPLVFFFKFAQHQLLDSILENND